MSIKTNFKHIALVAVAALGMGVLSSVPATAATSALTITVTNGTSGAVGAKSDSSNAATIQIAALLGASDSMIVTAVQKINTYRCCCNSSVLQPGFINTYIDKLYL